ncbi:unnamed protein product [Caenorhabditis angaria]|uniref:Uncharacterized protein n=1 Tax=Caenorhabditis angaria TaxID=860376 RepID=A0A9P1MZQ3_9PELO|nr:unnamed protein product [Caenorhabditis angaria]
MENSTESGIFSGMLRQIAATAATIDVTEIVKKPRISPIALKAQCKEYNRKSVNLENKIKWIKELKKNCEQPTVVVPPQTNSPSENSSEEPIKRRNRKRRTVE